MRGTDAVAERREVDTLVSSHIQVTYNGLSAKYTYVGEMSKIARAPVSLASPWNSACAYEVSS